MTNSFAQMTPATSIDRGLRNVALLVAGCFFMENLDGTIVTTAAPGSAARSTSPRPRSAW